MLCYQRIRTVNGKQRKNSISDVETVREWREGLTTDSEENRKIFWKSVCRKFLDRSFYQETTIHHEIEDFLVEILDGEKSSYGVYLILDVLIYMLKHSKVKLIDLGGVRNYQSYGKWSSVLRMMGTDVNLAEPNIKTLPFGWFVSGYYKIQPSGEVSKKVQTIIEFWNKVINHGKYVACKGRLLLSIFFWPGTNVIPKTHTDSYLVCIQDYKNILSQAFLSREEVSQLLVTCRYDSLSNY